MDFASDPQALLQQQFLSNAVQDWLVALGVFVGVFVVLRIMVGFIVRRARKVAEKTSNKFDDAIIGIIGKISGFFYFAASLFIASTFLSLPSTVSKVLYGLFVLALVFEAIRILQKIILFFVERVWLEGRQDQQHVSYILSLLIRIALWSIGLLLVLSNLGFDITSLVASLGIGGVAVALAIQNILSDLFSSLSIYIDQPFKVGDFIIVGDHMGTVEHIGLKTTRLRALQGEEIVISNSELTSARVQNFKRMQKRRIVFAFGVTYDTSTEKVKKIPEMVKNAIDPLEKAEYDRAHFKNFGDSSLDFEVVYYVLTGDYTEYMDIQQSINLRIMEEFEKEGIEMAFPTRTVHLVK